MASTKPNAADNGRNVGPRPIVVTPTLENHGVTLTKFIIVWALSAIINVGVIVVGFILLSLIGLLAPAPAEAAEVAATTEVEDIDKQPDLTNTDVGLDDTLSTQYNVDRIEDVSVPGKVDPAAPPGILNAPETAPSNVPPPPGSGGGTGAAAPAADAGTGQMAGTVGGMGGVPNIFSPGGFAGRSGATRQKMLVEGGGNAISEACVARGLEWIALHQAQDGHWSLHEFNKHSRTEAFPGGKISTDNSVPNTNRNNNVAGTAFALLPFLAAGQTQKPPKKGTQKDYSKGIGQGLAYLIKVQDKTRGTNSGYYGGDMYSHALASIGMCEAYGLTSDPTLKASAQMAINYIVNAQDPAGGGWRYSPRTAGDTSVTGWCLMALKSGQMAGLTVPKATLKKVEAYLDSAETSSPKGGYGYMPGTPSTVTMTAVGLLCRQYLGVNPRNPSLQAGIQTLKKLENAPGKTNNLYYEYYATQVLHHMDGEDWQYWNKGPGGDGKGGIRDHLIAKQDKGGTRQSHQGTWEGHDHVGGRLGATSLSLLSLEVYYRHLPLYRRDTGVMKPEEK
jgi:hypothetical protein